MSYNPLSSLITITLGGAVGVAYAAYEVRRTGQPASHELTARVYKLAKSMGGIPDSLEVREGRAATAKGFTTSLPLFSPIVFLEKEADDWTIAHELSHIKKYHGEKLHGLGIAGAFAIHALFKKCSVKLGVAGIALFPIVGLAYNRHLEMEADLHAMKYVDTPALKTAIQFFYRHLHAADEDESLSGLLSKLQISTIGSTHPPVEARIAVLQRELARRNKPLTHQKA